MIMAGSCLNQQWHGGLLYHHFFLNVSVIYEVILEVNIEQPVRVDRPVLLMNEGVTEAGHLCVFAGSVEG